jgi:hypothetical protein
MRRMKWAEFAQAAPELAALGEERFRRQELCMLGTLRRNGWPRISPCEPDFAAGELFLGMMWQSPKALDLLRDPRCVLHSCTSSRDGTEGDFKLYGRATDVHDDELTRLYQEAIRARLDWAPTGSYHLFAIDVDSAGFVTFGADRHVLAWDPERGLRQRRIP